MLPGIDEKSPLFSGNNPASPLSNMPTNAPVPINTNLDTGKQKLSEEDMKLLPDNIRERIGVPPANAKKIPKQQKCHFVFHYLIVTDILTYTELS